MQRSLRSKHRSHGWRPDQCGLLRIPARRVFRGMGGRVWGAARSLPKQFVSVVRQVKVPPRLRRSACPPQGFWRRGYAQAGTGLLRRPHGSVRLSFFHPWLNGYAENPHLSVERLHLPRKDLPVFHPHVPMMGDSQMGNRASRESVEG